MNATSFISEHTAEYILVPRIVSLLAPHFSHIVPFYFWMSREGGVMSRQCDRGAMVRLVSVFARRPKVSSPTADLILIKVNAELFQAAHTASRFGIPVLAGVPLVTSIADATLDAPCVWFRLSPDASGIGDIELTMDPNGHVVGTNVPTGIVGPLNAENIVTQIREASQDVTWSQGVENLRQVRSNIDLEQHTFSRFGGYKPFHLMLVD